MAARARGARSKAGIVINCRTSIGQSGETIERTELTESSFSASSVFSAVDVFGGDRCDAYCVETRYSVFDLFVDRTTEGTEPTETFSSVFSVISVVGIATYFSKAL